ncbi:MAG TPA: response regulator [Terriglobales bacterium]|nr:response regulator [Terriglobales bacterium]
MGIKILLADDSTTAQNMGKKILSEAGHDVVTVSNGAAAAKKIAEIHPDLVLLDVFMPGYTGLELCEKLRNAAGTSKLPVLLTVGRMEPYNAQDGARVRADGVIVKPFEASDLTAAVDRLATKAKTGKSQSGSSATVTPFQKPDSFPATAIFGSSAVSSNGDHLHSSVAAEVEQGSELPVQAAEEFTISASPGAEPAPQTATPAFHEELASVAPAIVAPEPQLGDHVASYLESTPELNSAPADSHFGTKESSAPFALEKRNEQPAAFGELETFESAQVQEIQVTAPEGFETTAPVQVDAKVVQEPGFEATLHSPAASDIVAPDPAFISDLHHSTNDFPTSFGGSESHSTPELPVTDSASAAAPVDDFESRLQAAMSSFEEPADPLMARLESEVSQAKGNWEVSPVEEFNPALSSIDPPVEISSPTEEEPISEPTVEENRLEPSWLSALPAAYRSRSTQPELESTSEPESSESEPRQEDAVAASAEPSGHLNTPAVSSGVKTARVPDTDELVIQQMRESLARLRDDVPAAIEAEAAPMAMAATAGAAVTTPDFSVREQVASELTLSDAEPAAPVEASAESDTKPAHEHGIASVVERVMQRELPGLIGKIMEELKLHKHS